MTLRCADCGKRAPNVPLAGQLPDPDGIRDSWQEHWTREVGLPHYTYTPSTTCNGCTGTLVDDDGAVVVQGLSKEGLELAHYRISVAAAEEGITSIFDPGWFNA